MIQLPKIPLVMVTPRREFKGLEVTDIATGKRIKIKDFRFNPAIHKDPKECAIKVEPVSAPTPQPIVPEKSRFDILKEKGWSKLNKQERIEYKQLKDASKC